MSSGIVSHLKSYAITLSEDMELNLSVKLKLFQASPILGRYFFSFFADFLDYFFCEVLYNNCISEAQSSSERQLSF